MKLMKFLLLLLYLLFIPVASAEQVTVDDISIKYDIQGKGDPILLINGFGGRLDSWSPAFIQELAENHTVITFSNRGVGNTTAGDKLFTIKQFAQDTEQFLEAINVTKTDVLGFSMGGMVAQELALTSNKIDKLILASSHCGQRLAELSEEVIDAINSEPSEIRQKLIEINYPEWFDFSNLPKSQEKISERSIIAQQDAIAYWPGTCHELDDIKQETLVLVGKDDVMTPPYNSIVMAKNIPNSTLIQIEGGHSMAEIYPEKVANIIMFFLS
jgi:pimeloyl-ACP methyl ester carboxylesterase